ncbi:MAG TPA: ATP-binding protein [Dehalococcoidia bacterium]|nr:ATP-binding protein [Dehalococcoidia bacterium]
MVAARIEVKNESPRWGNGTTPPETPFRPQPNSVEETGIDFGQLLDLCVKTIYYGGRPSARTISSRMAMPFPIVENLLTFLKREQYIEVVGSSGIGEQQYQYALTSRGQEKAVEALERNQYVGPAPVPFEEYVEVVLEQSVRKIRVDATVVERALSELVLSETTHNLIGPAVNSGRSILLYGDPGNGKSSIAKAIGKMLPGEILVPHAVDINGQTVKVFDPRVHNLVADYPEEDRRVNPASLPTNGERRRDLRWAVCTRPVIMAGGELTLADLELRYSPQSKFYMASLQVKANCGILVVDDFGRQLVQPKELLNRWIVPMEARVDHLTLLSGDTVEIPFECLLVFSTNLPPHSLGDEAFFRRIRHKIEVGDPDEAAFLRILEMMCRARNIPYAPEGGRYLIEKWYRPKGRHFRGCHPRDITDLLLDIASFRGSQPAFTPQWIDLACASYFIEND